MITPTKDRYRRAFERSYGAGRWEEFCHAVVVNQTRPGIIQDRFVNVNSRRPMSRPTYYLWAARAQEVLAGLV